MTEHTDMARVEAAAVSVDVSAAQSSARQEQAPDPARRGFLKAAPLGALAVVTGSTQAEETKPPAPASAPGAKRGYHETDHIRRYYQSAAYW